MHKNKEQQIKFFTVSRFQVEFTFCLIMAINQNSSEAADVPNTFVTLFRAAI